MQIGDKVFDKKYNRAVIATAEIVAASKTNKSRWEGGSTPKKAVKKVEKVEKVEEVKEEVVVEEVKEETPKKRTKKS